MSTHEISSTPAQAALLDINAVAQLLDCSARHVRRMVHAGHFPQPVRLGGTLVRWRRAEVDAWLAQGCKPIQSAVIQRGA